MLLFIIDVICSVILAVYLCSRAVAFVRRFERPRYHFSENDKAFVIESIEKAKSLADLAEHKRTNVEQGSEDNEL